MTEDSSEREGLEDGSETWYDAWIGDSGTDNETGSRLEDVQRWIPWTKEFEDGAARQGKDRNPQRRGWHAEDLNLIKVLKLRQTVHIWLVNDCNYDRHTRQHVASTYEAMHKLCSS